MMDNGLGYFDKMECHICENIVYMSKNSGLVPECQNCYITKLELMKKEENEKHNDVGNKRRKRIPEG